MEKPNDVPLFDRWVVVTATHLKYLFATPEGFIAGTISIKEWLGMDPHHTITGLRPELADQLKYERVTDLEEFIAGAMDVASSTHAMELMLLMARMKQRLLSGTEVALIPNKDLAATFLAQVKPAPPWPEELLEFYKLKGIGEPPPKKDTDADESDDDGSADSSEQGFSA